MMFDLIGVGYDTTYTNTIINILYRDVKISLSNLIGAQAVFDIIDVRYRKRPRIIRDRDPLNTRTIRIRWYRHIIFNRRNRIGEGIA